MVNSPLFTSSKRGFSRTQHSNIVGWSKPQFTIHTRRRRRRPLTMTWNWQSNRRRVKEHNSEEQQHTQIECLQLFGRAGQHWLAVKLCLKNDIIAGGFFFIVSEVFIVSLQWSPRDVALWKWSALASREWMTRRGARKQAIQRTERSGEYTLISSQLT